MDAVAIAKEDYSPEAQAAVTALRDLAQELEDTHGDFCWARYADQIPGGILLLFLLATLGALYRYNILIAAFYHARADALVMTVIDKLILRTSA